jgi:hypothetical protein
VNGARTSQNNLQINGVDAPGRDQVPHREPVGGANRSRCRRTQGSAVARGVGRNPTAPEGSPLGNAHAGRLSATLLRATAHRSPSARVLAAANLLGIEHFLEICVTAVNDLCQIAMPIPNASTIIKNIYVGNLG